MFEEFGDVICHMNVKQLKEAMRILKAELALKEKRDALAKKLQVRKLAISEWLAK